MSLTLRKNYCLVIAEAGTCHASANPARRYEKAVEYVHAAVRAGADAIKFQIFDDPKPRTMFCWIEGDEERAKRWHQSRLPLEVWQNVKAEADARDIMFLASVFEHETVKWLGSLGVPATKVASRAAEHIDEFENAPRPLLVSEGMTRGIPGEDRIILECESRYPSTKAWAGLHPGFSDHSSTPWRAVDAMAGGCQLLEVHFYVDPLDAGPDRPASLSAEELKFVCIARDRLADVADHR